MDVPEIHITIKEVVTNDEDVDGYTLQNTNNLWDAVDIQLCPGQSQLLWMPATAVSTLVATMKMEASFVDGATVVYVHCKKQT